MIIAHDKLTDDQLRHLLFVMGFITVISIVLLIMMLSVVIVFIWYATNIKRWVQSQESIMHECLYSKRRICQTTARKSPQVPSVENYCYKANGETLQKE